MEKYRGGAFLVSVLVRERPWYVIQPGYGISERGRSEPEFFRQGAASFEYRPFPITEIDLDCGNLNCETSDEHQRCARGLGAS